MILPPLVFPVIAYIDIQATEPLRSSDNVVTCILYPPLRSISYCFSNKKTNLKEPHWLVKDAKKVKSEFNTFKLNKTF